MTVASSSLKQLANPYKGGAFKKQYLKLHVITQCAQKCCSKGQSVSFREVKSASDMNIYKLVLSITYKLLTEDAIIHKKF